MSYASGLCDVLTKRQLEAGQLEDHYRAEGNHDRADLWMEVGIELGVTLRRLCEIVIAEEAAL